MFTKPPAKSSQTGTPAPTPLALSPSDSAPAKKAGPKVASLIAEEMTIEGGIAGEGELHVDGVVRGDIKVARLMVGDTGVVEGSITAEAVECRGKVVGSITAKQVRLYGASHVDGDITHEQLAMETGAFFQGRSLRFQRPVAAPQAAPAPKPVPALTAPAEAEVKTGS